MAYRHVLCRSEVASHPPEEESGNGAQRPEKERERLVAAVSKTAAEHGFAGLTIARILQAAGIDRAVFDAYFDSREQALSAAQDAFFGRLLWEATGACEHAAPWPVRVSSGLRAVLSAIRESASLARVFAVEADASVGLVLAERQLVALDDFADLLRMGRQDWPAAARLPELTERALVGAIASIVGQRLLREELSALSPLEIELTELLLIPYVGPGAAHRIALAPPRSDP